MAEANPPATGGDQTPDPLKNVKAEFDRKLGNVNQQLEQTNKTLSGLVGQLQAMAKPAAAQQKPAPTIDKEIEDSWYDSPAKAASLIAERAKNEIRQELQSAGAIQQKTTNTLNALVSEFPELSDQEHEFTKRAIAIYSEMPEDEKSSPASYKAAVREAALEMGVKPRSKRTEDDDNFSLRSGGNYSSRGDGGNARRRNTLDPAVADFARMVGVNPDDPKVKERLISNHGRKTWDRWE